MRKVGLFLTAQPTDGGGYQFSRSVLDAFRALPLASFEKTIYFSGAAWRDALVPDSIPAAEIKRDAGWRFFDGIWRRFGLSIPFWRSVSKGLSPLAKRMLSERCALWIFPAQDSLAYQVPVPALAPVFDLMHRYEPRFPEVGSWGRGRRRDFHYSALCAFAEGILVDSEVGKQQLLDSYRVDAGKVHILPFVPSSDFYHASSLPRTADHRLPDKFFVYPAQFWQHKNHTNLIKAVASLREGVPDIQVVLIGARKNGYEGALRLSRELGVSESLRFLGFVPDAEVPAILRRARAMIYPTFFGPTNIPPLEAFATGCPVACSRIYGMPAQVSDAALLFDPKSVEELASAMRRLWTDDALCRQLTERGRRMAAQWGPPQFNSRFRDIVGCLLEA